MNTLTRRSVAAAGAFALAAAATGIAFTSSPAAAAQTDVPRQPLPTEFTLAVPSDDGTTLAWTGAPDRSELREYASPAAAADAGLTPFSLIPDANGFAKIVAGGASFGYCLYLGQTTAGTVGASLSKDRCGVAASNWTVTDGRITSPYGYALGNETARVDGTAGLAATASATGADFGIETGFADAVPPTTFDVTSPTTNDPNDRAVLRGRTAPSSTVLVTDRRGASLVRGTVFTDATGAWEAHIDSPPRGVTELDVLVTVSTGQTVRERSWGTVSYGAGISAASDTTPIGVDGTTSITGTGDPGAAVRVVTGGRADPVVVGRDGTWTIDVTVDRAKRAPTSSVVLEMAGVGGQRTVVPVAVRAASLDADVVFPADAAESAYVEGDAEPGSTIEVRATDGATVGTATTDTRGHFEVEVGAPDASGRKDLRVVERSDGEVIAQDDVTADYGAPVRILSPSTGGTLTPGSEVVGTGEPGAEVALELGGKTVHTIVDADGEWSARFGDAGDRPFALTIPDALRFTERSKPAITGTGIPGAVVRFQPTAGDDTGHTDTTVRPDGTWRIAGADLRLTVGQRYEAAVVQRPGSADERTERVRLESDLRPITVTSPEAGATISPDHGYVTFSGTASPGDQLAVRVPGGDRVASTVVRADGTWTIPDVLFPQGQHTARIVGLYGDVDVSFTVESDTGSQLRITSPTEGSTVDADPDFTNPGVRFSGTAAPGAYGGIVDLRDGTVRGFQVDAYGAWQQTLPLREGASHVRVTDTVNAPVELRFTTRWPVG